MSKEHFNDCDTASNSSYDATSEERVLKQGPRSTSTASSRIASPLSTVSDPEDPPEY